MSDPYGRSGQSVRMTFGADESDELLSANPGGVFSPNCKAGQLTKRDTMNLIVRGSNAP